MTQARAGAACIALTDGSVLVTGGTDGTSALASAEVYDVSTDSWQAAGSMGVARAGHTATMTAGGDVLLVGGEDTGAVELFLTNGRFLNAGTLAASRSGHAVATIGHKILIAGGVDGSNSALPTVEIYDGLTGKLSPAGTMLTARRNFAAAPLADGTVLLTGGYGSDGSMLASSEIFDPISGTSIAGPTMLAARAQHTSTVLAGNGRVLLIGGIGQDGSTAAGEVFTPWTRSFENSPAMHTARQHMVTAMLRRGALVAAGGKGPDGTLDDSEIYAFATLDPDKTEYAPGQQVAFDGVGWNPGEQVLIQIAAFPLDRHGVEFTATATADSTGRIRVSSFEIDRSHLGTRFLAKATGQQSQAQSIFTAAIVPTLTTTASPSSPTVGQLVDLTSCVTTVSSIIPTGTITFKIGNPISSAITLVNGCATFQYARLTGGGSTVSVTYSGDSNYSFNIPPAGNLNLTVARAATSSSVSSSPVSPVDFGVSVQLTGTVTSPATAVNGFQIGGVANATFQDNGVDIPGCALLTVSNGTANCNWGIPSIGSHSIVLFFLNNDPNFLPSSSAPTPVVSKRTATAGSLTTTPASPIVYNTATTARVQFSPSEGGPALTGTVSFFDGATLLGSATVVSGGNTDFALPTSVIQSVGSHILTAQYNGDSSYFATLPPFPTTTLVVSKSPTNTSTPALTGTVLSVVVTPASGGGVPTGSVTFTIDSVAQSPVALDGSGTASKTVSLAPGSHTFSAAYSGDATFLASASGPVSLTVPSATATTGALSTIPASPIAYNTAAIVRAQFGPSAGGPALTGAVSFFDGATLLGSATVVSGGNTDFALPPSVMQSVGSHILTARYNGDSNYLATVAPLPAATLVVNKAATNTSAPALTGSTLSAVVTPASGGVPTGTVIFTIDGVAQTAVTITASGAASMTVNAAPGSHTFSAAYSGDANFLASASGTVSQSVSAPPGLRDPILTVTSNPAAPASGQTVTITVNVGSTGPTPTGTVQFFEGGTLLGTAQLSAGQAAFVGSFSVGSHSILVKYSGDGSTREGSTIFNLGATWIPLSLTLTSNLLTSVYGQAVTLTATLATQASTSVGLPNGTIQFLDGTTVIATGTLSKGVAVATVSNLEVGIHQIRASFAGDSNFYGANSTILTVLVTKAQTALTLTALPDFSNTPQVTLTSTIGVVAPGGGMPTGLVQFVDTVSNVVLATATLAGGTAKATLLLPDASSRTFAAVFATSPNYIESKSPDAIMISIVNAASFNAYHASPDEIMSIFGANLASGVASAPSLPLPFSLSGTSVNLTDQGGLDHPVALHYVSPTQINLQIPPDVPLGTVRVTVTNAKGDSFAIVTLATATTPGIFAANANGRGIAAAQVVRVASDGSQKIENVAKLDSSQKVFVAAPISFGSDQLFLTLYGTGIRHTPGVNNVTCTINGQPLTILFAGAQPTFAGLDQINVPLPRTLAGTGSATIVVKVDGQTANSVEVMFQ